MSKKYPRNLSILRIFFKVLNNIGRQKQKVYIFLEFLNIFLKNINMSKKCLGHLGILKNSF